MKVSSLIVLLFEINFTALFLTYVRSLMTKIRMQICFVRASNWHESCWDLTGQQKTQRLSRGARVSVIEPWLHLYALSDYTPTPNSRKRQWTTISHKKVQKTLLLEFVRSNKIGAVIENFGLKERSWDSLKTRLFQGELDSKFGCLKRLVDQQQFQYRTQGCRICHTVRVCDTPIFAI